MEIIIKVLNDEGEVIASSESLSFESAEQELGKMERFLAKQEFRAEIEAENFAEDLAREEIEGAE